MKKGAFVVIEGLDGSGKTTLSHLIRQVLAKDGQAMYTREPGGTTYSEDLRTLMFRSNLETQAFLYGMLSARADLCSNVLRQTLDSGITVICDRYFHSTFAYQGVTHELRDHIKAAANASWFIKPDLVIQLNCDPEVALGRVNARAGDKNVFDTAELGVFSQRCDRYAIAGDFLYGESVDHVQIDVTESYADRHIDDIIKYIKQITA